jgi:hypothetical protein
MRLMVAAALIVVPNLKGFFPLQHAADAASAVPIGIAPGSEPMNLELVLTRPGNSFLESRQKGTGTYK